MWSYFWEEVLELCSYLIPIIFIFGLVIVLPAIVFNYYASCREAEIYNRLNGTSYTCSDFFWASDQINSSTKTIKVK